MAAPLSPRTIRSEAHFDAEAMLEYFQEIVDAGGRIDRAKVEFTDAVDREIAHIMRRTANANVLRRQIIDTLRVAQHAEDFAPGALSVAM